MLQDTGDDLCIPRAGVTTKPNAKSKGLPTASHSRNLPTTNHSETELPPCSTPDPPMYPAPPPPPPLAPPPLLFHNLQSCVDAARSACGPSSTINFTAASQECSYLHQSPGPSSSSLLPTPPPLIRAPVQLSMPFMYAPMYLPSQTQQTHETLRETEGSTPFLLVFVKGNIARCAGCGKKDLRDANGKVHPPPDDICLLHKELNFITFENLNTGLRQKSQEKRNVYYHARKVCVLKKCGQPKVVVQADVRVKLSSLHMHHIMEEFGLQVLNNSE